MPQPPIPAEDFLKALRTSGLLSPVELVELLSTVPAEDRKQSPALAATLVRSGALTRFQAKKLLIGATRGLVLGPYRILAMLGRGGCGKVYLRTTLDPIGRLRSKCFRRPRHVRKSGISRDSFARCTSPRNSTIQM